jgi:hypothetical protein
MGDNSRSHQEGEKRVSGQKEDKVLGEIVEMKFLALIYILFLMEMTD